VNPAIFGKVVLRAVGASLIAAIALLVIKAIAGNPLALDFDDLSVTLPIVFIATFLASLPNNEKLR
jgi:hypothetical protein